MAQAEAANDYCIGIDLGTTYACVAVLKKENGQVEILANEHGNRTTPSYVAFEGKQIMRGEAAKSQAVTNPSNTIYDVKKLIGRKFDDDAVKRNLDYWNFNVVDDNGNPSILLETSNERKYYSPEMISGEILKYMKDIASKYLGQEVSKAVITVPSYFNDAQRDATRNAGIIAGLNVLRIVNEPTAAGIAFDFCNKNQIKDKKRYLLVFDLGENTLEVSILAIQNGVYEVVVTSGDSHLGGQDFDNNVVDYFVDALKKKNIDITENPKARIKLKNACEIGKRNLTQNNATKVIVESLVEEFDFSEDLSRSLFNTLNKELYEKLKTPIEKTLDDANLTKEDIEDVVLIGGASRMLEVQNMISEMFPDKIRKDINNDEAVAYGAAVLGAFLNGEKHEILENFSLKDVTALSLGMELAGGQMEIFIQRNTPIPQTVTKFFTTSKDTQSSVRFVIYEGERPIAKENNCLGEFIISGIRTGRKDSIQIKVTLAINLNGILEVSATESLSGINENLKIENVGRLSEVEVVKMIQDSIKFREDDEREKARIEARLELEDYVNNIIHKIDEISTGNKDAIKTKCNEITKWIHENEAAEKDQFINQLNTLKTEWKHLE